MSDTAVRNVETTMKYVVRGEKATFHPGERDKSYWPVDEHRVTIHDVRPEIRELALERNGFVVADEPTDVTDFTDQAELARYCTQTEALVQRRSTPPVRGPVLDVVDDERARVQRLDYRRQLDRHGATSTGNGPARFHDLGANLLSGTRHEVEEGRIQRLLPEPPGDRWIGSERTR